MAVVSVNRALSREEDVTSGPIRLIDEYLVEVDDPTDGPVVAREAVGVPRFQDEHPDNPNAFVVNIGTKDIPGTRLLFLVVIEYDTSVFPISLIPENEEPQIAWSGLEREMILEKDINNKPIVNSANDKFDPPPTESFHQMVCNIQRNESDYNPKTAEEFLDTVNVADITIAGYEIAAEQARMVRFSGRTLDRQGQILFTVSYEIHVAKLLPLAEPVLPATVGTPLFHRRDILDQGLNTLVGSTKTPIIDNANAVVKKAVLLDLDGDKLDPALDGKFITFETLKKTDWESLDLPEGL